ncbi:hypothetical protein [Variovorax sp. RA8]|uniref:hypothetical protein n=1 Tax=Variovorax sp. (strain JCM 16519 / RA8) TaxID=662548 RepID=UPI000A6B726C|nr:hypothetical protein [Variovorax sp. RA8]VTU34209.1 hypothetical protein RA8CHR_04927 [Variovorax sp. RA8]
MEEAKFADVPPMDWGMAAVQSLIATLVTLQRNGVLQISDVVSEIGNTIDYRTQHFPERRAKDQVLQHVYEMMMLADKNEAELAALKAKRDAAGGLPPSK